MSWDDDVRDADWRAYLIKNAKRVTDDGDGSEDQPRPAAEGAHPFCRCNWTLVTLEST